jgi:hypothetical protein
MSSHAPIVSNDEAFLVAHQFEARGDERMRLLAELAADDMLGLECAATVQLEKLLTQDAIDGQRLAKWILHGA